MSKVKILILLVAVIKIIYSSPVVSQDFQKLIKRDVKHSLGKSDQPIYGNGIPGDEAEVTFYVYKIAPNGNYFFAYKQNDLQEREETGIYEYDEKNRLRKLKVTGFFEYIRPDGKKQRVDYESDEDGYKPDVQTE